MNLENNGERMDIDYFNMKYENFDGYQKSHYKRYEFARTLINDGDVVGDMACGSGYGSMMLLEKSKEVYSIDIDPITINEVDNRYKNENIHFVVGDLIDLKIENKFDKIVSFETLEHFTPDDFKKVIANFHKALKQNGTLIFSTPYNQEQSEASMRFHKTFYITEKTIDDFFKDLFEIDTIKYQDYQTHVVKDDDGNKNFIIGIVKKIN
jgi:2-polyprenyl-3-methyl-5-hydroxy-6-metoxy-1,4-benzoquinol methylase